MADRSVLASNSFETFRTTFNSTASDVGDIANLLAATGTIASSTCLLYTSPSPRDVEESRMPSSA